MCPIFLTHIRAQEGHDCIRAGFSQLAPIPYICIYIAPIPYTLYPIAQIYTYIHTHTHTYTALVRPKSGLDPAALELPAAVSEALKSRLQRPLDRALNRGH